MNRGYWRKNVNTRSWRSRGITLVHRLRRWPNISPTLSPRLMFIRLLLFPPRVLNRWHNRKPINAMYKDTGTSQATMLLLFSTRATQRELSKWPFKHRECLTRNPSNPHDALKHHFPSLKTDLISLELTVLERKFPWNWFTNTCQFSLIFHPHQVIFIHYKSRIATEIRGL